MNGVEVGLSIGSNLGDRLENLRRARTAVSNLSEVMFVASSPLYETEPVGVSKEDSALTFYNAVIILNTTLSVQRLFSCLEAIEASLGRKRSLFKRNAPRTVDIDLIYYNGQVIRNGPLIVPHPRALLRRFVLQPLADVRKNLILPRETKTIYQILAAMPADEQPVKQILVQW